MSSVRRAWETDVDDRDRRDRLTMLVIAIGSGLVIAVVLYSAGAFRASTG